MPATTTAPRIENTLPFPLHIEGLGRSPTVNVAGYSVEVLLWGDVNAPKMFVLSIEDETGAPVGTSEAAENHRSVSTWREEVLHEACCAVGWVTYA